MAEGMRLKYLSEHINSLERRMQKLTSDYQERIKELTDQVTEVREVDQRHYESLQLEATKRHESVLRDSASRYGKLLKLLAGSSSQHRLVSQVPVAQEEHVELSNNSGESTPVLVQEGKRKGILPTPHRPTEHRGQENLLAGGMGGQLMPHSPYPKLDFPYSMEMIPGHG